LNSVGWNTDVGKRHATARVGDVVLVDLVQRA